ncbi:MAG TPA: dephospho-CoA kinase [Spirochaetaceae bacterium]|nr:dephospho-CoA kinase [Spirochaetaceae bacterium]
MKVIGVTGGIASGKSMVSGWLHKHYGAVVLDADEVAREIAEPGEPLWMAFVSRYGEKCVLLEDGTLNREAVAEIVFHNKAERMWMDDAAHPLIKQRMLERLEACKEAGEKLVVLDVPLLYEAGWEKIPDEIWVVYLEPQLQIQRLMHRNKISETLAQERIASQMPMEEKKRRADVIIDNNGSREETVTQIQAAIIRQVGKR